MKYELIAFAFIATIMCVLFGLGLGLKSYKCHAQWEESGYESKWSPIAGCRIKRDNGKWVPASAARDIGLAEGSKK